MTTKMIKDSIHGFIEFEGHAENGLRGLLSDPFFQRLRRVKQLGFSDYVFPSATHSRFAHSLGVYSVARRMLSVIEPNTQPSQWSLNGKACLAAALLHDVGHGMFSHAFENAMKFYFARNPDPNGERRDLLKAVDHEEVTLKIVLESSVTEILKNVGGNKFPDLVAGMIRKENPGCIYTAVVSSQLDADRLDYAKRDPYFAGVSSGGIDLDWLVRNLKVGGENNKFFYVDSKAYISLEQFAVTLFQLYPTIYLHKKTRGLEYMFALLMSRIFELIAEGHIKDAGIASSHPFVRFFQSPSKLENILRLDDTLFWGSLYLFQEAKDPIVKEISSRISERRIYPVIDVWKIADQAAVGTAIENMAAPDRVKILRNTCEEVCAELQKEDALPKRSYYYDTYGRPIYKPKNIIGGDAQQINVKVGSAIVDIASISPIVASAASFNIHRIYYDDNVSDLGSKLNSYLSLAVKDKIAKLMG